MDTNLGLSGIEELGLSVVSTGTPDVLRGNIVLRGNYPDEPSGAMY
ncbi:hypothetical protein [Bremerella sp.]